MLNGVLAGLLREIHRAYALISPSVLTDTLKPYTNEEFQLAIESLRAFARQRTTFVNAEVAAARAVPSNP